MSAEFGATDGCCGWEGPAAQQEELPERPHLAEQQTDADEKHLNIKLISIFSSKKNLLTDLPASLYSCSRQTGTFPFLVLYEIISPFSVYIERY